MTEKKINKVCIISLTYNRSEYNERSFHSLYQRAGLEFDHYVFDDCSDTETQTSLKKLQEQYHFNLVINQKTLGIVGNFVQNIKKIEMKYDYYVKFDSDIEILSDNFFSSILDVFAIAKQKISCITSKAEGLSSMSDRRIEPIEFYGGHAVRFNASIEYGCCLVFPKYVFESFVMTDAEKQQKWGLDHMIYTHSRQIGSSVIVEDLSMYHIDNLFGQRRKYADYFIKRKRWDLVDVDEVWFLAVTKDFYPEFINRTSLNTIKQEAKGDYKRFWSMCKTYIASGLHKYDTNLAIEIKKSLIVVDITQYRITCPSNFSGTSTHLAKGESILVDELPDWAYQNSSVVIEKIITKKVVNLLSDVQQ